MRGLRHCSCGVFLCPESQCPQNTSENGACGGSHNGRCEVHPREKVAYGTGPLTGLPPSEKTRELTRGCIPPQNVGVKNNTSSWINFHLKTGPPKRPQRKITQFCSAVSCRLDTDMENILNLQVFILFFFQATTLAMALAKLSKGVKKRECQTLRPPF